MSEKPDFDGYADQVMVRLEQRAGALQEMTELQRELDDLHNVLLKDARGGGRFPRERKRIAQITDRMKQLRDELKRVSKGLIYAEKAFDDEIARYLSKM